MADPARPGTRNGSMKSDKRHSIAPTQDFSVLSRLVDAVDDYGNTILHLKAKDKTANEKPFEFDEVLISRIDYPNNYGETPLHIACFEENQAFAELLLKKGADVNAVDLEGLIPLHITCYQQYKDLAELLLNSGANINAKDFSGLTPLHHAIIAQGRAESKQEMIESKNDGEKATGNNESVARLLLTKSYNPKLDLYATTKQGATALYLAVAWALTDLAELLIKRGAEINTMTWRGETVIHRALRTMIEDEKRDPKGMVNIGDKTRIGDSNPEGAATGGYKIASYGEKMMSIIVPTDQQAREKELLTIVYQEDDENIVRYSARRLLPSSKYEEIEKEIKRRITLWLALRPEKFERLEKELIKTLREKEIAPNSHHDTLISLAVQCGDYDVLKLILQSKPWSRKEKDDAKKLIPKDAPREMLEYLWRIPFLQRTKRGAEDYEYPTIVSNKEFVELQSSVINFYENGRTHTDLVHHSCSTQDLLYNGEKGPAGFMEEALKVLNGIPPKLNTDMYNESRLRFRWIHLPINCMDWMDEKVVLNEGTLQAATKSLYIDKDYALDDYTDVNKFLLQSWHELPETNNEADKYMNPTCVRDMTQERGARSIQAQKEASSHLALYMPYISFAIPDYQEFKKEKQLDNAEDGNAGKTHQSRTLDTWYLSTFNESKARRLDSNQIVYKHARGKLRKLGIDQLGDDQIPIVHVGQLWLWAINKDTIVTSESLDHHNPSPIFTNILEYLTDNKERLGRDIIPSSLDGFVKFIASFCINTPFNHRRSLAPIFNNPDYKIDITETSKARRDKIKADAERKSGTSGTSELGEKEVDKTLEHKPDIYEQSWGPAEFINKNPQSLYEIFLTCIELVRTMENDLRRKFSEEMHIQDKGKKIDENDLHKSVTDTVELLSEIKDIQQELSIIESVLGIQETVWDQLCKDSGKSTDAQTYVGINWGNGIAPATYVRRRIQELFKFGEETQNQIDSILQLKMNQLSLIQAEVARRQGTTIMVFTIVTVIFTPLSFLLALFALNVSIFPHSGNEVLYEPGWLFRILFGVTAGFTLIVGIITFVVVKRRGISRGINRKLEFLKEKKKQESPGQQEPQSSEQDILHSPEQESPQYPEQKGQQFPGWGKQRSQQMGSLV